MLLFFPFLIFVWRWFFQRLDEFQYSSIYSWKGQRMLRIFLQQCLITSSHVPVDPAIVWVQWNITMKSWQSFYWSHSPLVMRIGQEFSVVVILYADCRHVRFQKWNRYIIHQQLCCTFTLLQYSSQLLLQMRRHKNQRISGNMAKTKKRETGLLISADMSSVPDQQIC